jgi:hypothetical protein
MIAIGVESEYRSVARFFEVADFLRRRRSCIYSFGLL